MDFEHGIDRIDLSAFALVKTLADLTFINHVDGVTLTFDAELIRVITDDGERLGRFDFSAEDFILF